MTADSRDHQIDVVPVSTPSSLRVTDPYGYDNYDESSTSPVLQYALDALWDLATSQIPLPLPSPWGYILDDDENRLTVTPSPSLDEVTFSYDRTNADRVSDAQQQDLNGADWLWFVNSPVDTGWYLIDVDAKATTGKWAEWNTAYVWEFRKYDDVTITHFADFEVYRS